MASIADFARPARAGRSAWRWFWRFVASWMPKGLFARSLLIIIVPIVLLQAVVALEHPGRADRQWHERIRRKIARSG